MHFSFIKELFPELDTNILIENNIETVYIKNRQFSDVIILYYFPNDYYTYLFKFATQHFDTSSQDELIACIRSFVNGEKASIEFYENGKNQFGGEIEVSLLDELTYDKLRNYFGYAHTDLSNLTFKVRSWNNYYCFDGYFQKNNSGTVDIVKSFIIPSNC